MGHPKNAIKKCYEKKNGRYVLVSEEPEFIRDIDIFMSYVEPLKKLGGIEKTERKGTTMYHTSISPDRIQKNVWEWEC